MRIRAKMSFSGDSEEMLNRFLEDFKIEDVVAITQHGDQIIVFYKTPQ